ncbi:MAG: class I SAM-dependent methyltransferase [Thermoguttaceae bacterium]
MKTRESGMPEESMWQGFFDPETVLKMLGLTSACQKVVDFGCGYGTFTIPAARIVSGIVYGLDIEAEMVELTRRKAEEACLTNVEVRQRDFVVEGSGLPEASVDYVMLFNILHAEERTTFLREAWRVLAPEGKLAIIHWNYDPSTPRGPSLDIRPRPEDCRSWAEQVGFRLLPPGLIGLPPYHYGFVLRRGPSPSE